MCKLPQRMFFLKYLQKGLFEYKPEDNSFWYLIKKSYILSNSEQCYPKLSFH